MTGPYRARNNVRRSLLVGTIFGISGAARAVACSLAPACPPVPMRRGLRRIRR
jgi:hypothetical protein